MSDTVKQISVLQSNGSYISQPIGADAENVDIDATHTLADKASSWDSKANSSDLANYIPITSKGAINGVATLDADGKIPSSQIPGGIQPTITIDPIPAEDSTNAVSSGGVYSALGDKVDKENGKGLSTNDYTTAEKTKLEGLSNYDDTTLSGRISNIEEVVPANASTSNKLATMADVGSGGGGTTDYNDLTNKPQIASVTLSGDKSLSDLGIQAAETGKGLSTNDYTTAEKNKLAGLSNYDDSALVGRVVAIEGVVPSTATSSNKLATMSDLPSAGTTDYDDLSDKPQIAGVVLSGNKLLSDLGIQASESGKGLSANDYTDAEKTKLSGIETGAEVNVIESISVNGTPQTITNKNVDITVSGGGDIPIATTSVAGKIKPDGTTITVDENGTITAIGGGGGSYSTITPSDIDRLWGSSLDNGDLIVYDDIVDGDSEGY